MKILIACEFSGIVRESFKMKGHDVWSCDILDTEIEGNHIKCDVLEILDAGWDMMIAHPPCTYLCNSGVRWLSKDGKHSNIKEKNEERWKKMIEGAEFFKTLLNAPIKKICIENPIPHKYAREIIGKYTQIIHPWQFGHLEQKTTCLWLKNLSELKSTKIVKEEMLKLPKKFRKRIHYCSPGKDRWKIRSRTFTGIAEAMANQWG